MDDFTADPICRDTIRVDVSDEEIMHVNGRATLIISIAEAMQMAILLIQSIERAEVMDARSSPSKKTAKRKPK